MSHVKPRALLALAALAALLVTVALRFFSKDVSLTVTKADGTVSASGNPGTLVNGTGRYQGATGRVITSKEVKGGSNVVARIHLKG
jgi:hypothetical protein